MPLLVSTRSNFHTHSHSTLNPVKSSREDTCKANLRITIPTLLLFLLSPVAGTFSLQLLQYVKHISPFESFYYIYIANILWWTPRFNIIQSCQLQLYTILQFIYRNLPYCQFQGDGINSLCVYSLQDRNWSETSFCI